MASEEIQCYSYWTEFSWVELLHHFRQLYEETVAELKSELQSAMVDLGHKSAFDLILKDAWSREQAAMGNSTLPTVCDKLNLIASIHNRKLTAANG